MKLGLQDDTRHKFHFLDNERKDCFDEEFLQFAKKLANLETHTKLRRSLFIFVRGKVQVRFQDDEMLPGNFIGAAIAREEIGWDNMMEVRDLRA